MTHAHFGNLAPLRRPLMALLLAVAWCNVSVASDGVGDDGLWWRHSAVSISGTPATSVTVGNAYTFTPTASGPSDQTLVFSISNQPSWASFSTSTGALSGKPTASNVGTYSNIVIGVSDGHRSATLPAFNLQVLAGTTTTTAPPPPTISGTPATSVIAGNAYSFAPSASGPSGATLSFSVQNMPTWATFSIASGALTGTPTSAQTGTYSNIIISVSDGSGANSSAALPAFSITVNPATVTTGSATVAITPPTQNTNGTALTNLAGVTIYYGTSSSNLSQSVQVATTAATTYTISNLAVGTWYFAGQAYTSTGATSAMSPVVTANIQ
jgi:Putative Ig domain